MVVNECREVLLNDTAETTAEELAAQRKEDETQEGDSSGGISSRMRI